jgi:hypothetical protein
MLGMLDTKAAIPRTIFSGHFFVGIQQPIVGTVADGVQLHELPRLHSGQLCVWFQTALMYPDLVRSAESRAPSIQPPSSGPKATC